MKCPGGVGCQTSMVMHVQWGDSGWVVWQRNLTERQQDRQASCPVVAGEWVNCSNGRPSCLNIADNAVA